jgi:hypothetical protein
MEIVLPGVLMVMIFAGLPILLIWVIGRVAPRSAAIVFGALASIFLVYLIIDSYQDCSAAPIITAASDPGSPPDVEFACDAPTGVFAWLFILISGPISVVALAIAMSFQFRQLRRER